MVLVIAGIVLVIAAAFALQKEHSVPSTTQPGIPAKSEPTTTSGIPSVQVIKPQRQDMAFTLTLPANIAPLYQTTLYAKVSGYVKSMLVDKGDEVKKGQIIAILDAPEIADQYEQAEADYAIKRLTYERLAGVFKENPDVIAKQDVDVAQAAAKGALHLRDTRRTLLGYTKVDAPFDGTITARFADPGAMIQAATGSASQSTPLYTLMSLDTVRVYVSVPQEAAHLAVPGVMATLSSREFTNMVVKGTITRTTESLDPTTRTLLVEIDLPNKDRQLEPGMYIIATLYLTLHPHALAIPPIAIVPAGDGKGKSVFIVEQDRIRRVPIKTGIDDGVWVEVLEGLTGSEDVVVVGKGTFSEGQTVKAKPYSLPSGKGASQKQ
jgi:RND family efflux transporter MFP subunit